MTTEHAPDVASAHHLDVVVAEHRDKLVGVAYRLLGSVSDAEDAVQEAFLRLQRHGLDRVDNPGGWLSRTTTRICLDRLRSARVRRERYVGPWLPEPLATDGTSAEATAELAESVSMAFLVVLESLSPAERVVFVLHEVFGEPHHDIARKLDRSEDACRQLLARARKQVEQRRPRFDADRTRRHTAADRFLAACGSGQLDQLLEVLAPDVVLTADSDGKVSAARRPVVGADPVARFLLGVLRKADASLRIEPTHLNGAPGVIVRRPDGAADTALSLHVADGRIADVYVVRNPDKLRHLRTPA